MSGDERSFSWKLSELIATDPRVFADAEAGTARRWHMLLDTLVVVADTCGTISSRRLMNG
jgi:hypothetical protein